MKVLLIVNDLSGTHGYSTYARNIISLALEEGVQVIVTVHDVESTFHPEIQRKMLPEKPHNLIWNPFRIVKTCKLLHIAIAKEKPDVIHIVAEPYLMGFAFVRAGNIPVVLTVHGTYAYVPDAAHGLLRKLFSKVFFHVALRQVSAIIAVSEATKKRIVGRIPYFNKPIEVIHNSFELPKKEAVATRGDRESGIERIVTVGAVKRRKGTHDTIKIFSEWAAQRKQKVMYEVVGFCDEQSKFVKDVRALVEQYSSEYFEVRFHGQVSEEKKASLLNAASLYVHLERVTGDESDVEGFGIGIIEAAAYGLPALVAKGSATSEAVKDGITGYVVDLDDKTQIMDRIDKLLLDGSIETQDLLEWAESHSPRAMYKSIEAVYQKVIS